MMCEFDWKERVAPCPSEMVAGPVLAAGVVVRECKATAFSVAYSV